VLDVNDEDGVSLNQTRSVTMKVFKNPIPVSRRRGEAQGRIVLCPFSRRGRRQGYAMYGPYLRSIPLHFTHHNSRLLSSQGWNGTVLDIGKLGSNEKESYQFPTASGRKCYSSELAVTESASAILYISFLKNCIC